MMKVTEYYGKVTCCPKSSQVSAFGTIFPVKQAWYCIRLNRTSSWVIDRHSSPSKI
jgi:hypothetical protein